MAEQRYLVVLAVIEDVVEVTVVAENYQVNRQTVRSWPSRYVEGGLQALADRSPGQRR